MRGRTTRHGRIDTQPYLNRRVGTREVIAAYGLVLIVPVFLLAVSYPMLVGGAIALVGGGYTMGQVGIRVAFRRVGMTIGGRTKSRDGG